MISINLCYLVKQLLFDIDFKLVFLIASNKSFYTENHTFNNYSEMKCNKIDSRKAEIYKKRHLYFWKKKLFAVFHEKEIWNEVFLQSILRKTLRCGRFFVIFIFLLSEKYRGIYLARCEFLETTGINTRINK